MLENGQVGVRLSRKADHRAVWWLVLHHPWEKYAASGRQEMGEDAESK